jgi:hypothetical protein
MGGKKMYGKASILTTLRFEEEAHASQASSHSTVAGRVVLKRGQKIPESVVVTAIPRRKSKRY